METETRISQTDVEIRQSGDSQTLVGLAIPFGKLSLDLGGFREEIDANAFSESLSAGDSIVALVNHDPNQILARSPRTLALESRADGVHAEISLPSTTVGHDVAESVGRGDLNRMSFAFSVSDDEWSTIEGEQVRTIKKASLRDVSVVTSAAYPTTTVALRSLSAWRETRNKDSKMEKQTVEPSETEIKEPASTPEESKPTPERRTQPAEPRSEVATMNDASEWRSSRTGERVAVLSPEQRFSDMHKGGAPLSLGRMIRACVIGDWTGAPAEQRALSTTSNPSAGILVPSAMAATVIDKARAQSTLIQAGAQTIDMPSGNLTIARVNTDPTVEVHGENSALTGADVGFGGVQLTAFTLGVFVKMSRELADDAPNSVSLIENEMSSALANKIDRFGLQGTGSAEPLGLVNFVGTNTTAVGGSLDYDNILDALEQNELDDHVSTSAILSPANVAVLRKLKVNSEVNHYASPPSDVSALRMFSTTNMPDATGVVLDGSKFMIGLRQSPMVEVSTQAGTSFADHSVWIKATWRGCFATSDATSICLMTGIV